MDKQLKVLIADDHSLIRNGLRQVLESEQNIFVLEAEHGEQALQIIRDQEPDLAILDVEMPRMTGFDVARHAQRELLPTNIVFLTMFNDESAFNKAMDVGVRGYVLKENTVTEILHCVRAVLAGRHYLSPSISDYMVRRANRSASAAADKDGLNLLTPAEQRVLKLLASMKTNHEIADALGISVKTVHNHRNNICIKLGLRGAHALLKYAVENASRL